MNRQTTSYTHLRMRLQQVPYNDVAPTSSTARNQTENDKLRARRRSKRTNGTPHSPTKRHEIPLRLT
jgi:hypothetical protein